jgi:predicted phosphodiesterase
MPSSVVVLSDVHGVLPVLDDVLAEPEVAAADLIVVTGDHAAGPMPVETVDRLVGLGRRVRLVRGNADRELVVMAREPGSLRDRPSVSVWAAARLRSDQVDLLASLPHPVTENVDGFGEVLFCHGSPRDDDEVVLVDTRAERWGEALSGVDDTVQTVVCGHTHVPFVRQVDRRLVINAGSIGMPYGARGASWAHLRDGSVTLHRTPIDVDRVSRELRAGSAFPGIDKWIAEFIAEPASDLDALSAFGPRDGR